jgi:hypothetical protein
MVWSQFARIRTPPIVITNFLYVRFKGNRSIGEKILKIQKDRILEMSKWADEIKKWKRKRKRKEVE